jgi:hypothetical protein
VLEYLPDSTKEFPLSEKSAVVPHKIKERKGDIRIKCFYLLLRWTVRNPIDFYTTRWKLFQNW